MADYDRTGVLGGEDIVLRVILTDDTGELVDADSLPDVYIYDDSVDDDTIDTEVDDDTYASASAGPLAPTKIGTGFYELTYTVPSGASEGIWRDIWVGDVDGVTNKELLKFQVVAGAEFSEQNLQRNELVIVTVSQDVQSVGGDALDDDYELGFVTEYDPYFASPDLVRMELGPFVDFLSDDTLALMIHWSSKEAEFISGGPRGGNAKRLEYARAKFVVYDAVLRLVLMPGLGKTDGSVLNAAGGTKRLGDLSIRRGAGGQQVASLSSGVDVETFRELKKHRETWWRVVNAGGSINPGQGLGPQFAIKGRFDPNRRASGRQWAQTPGAPPTVNSKRKTSGRPGAKNKMVYSPSWPFYFDPIYDPMYNN